MDHNSIRVSCSLLNVINISLHLLISTLISDLIRCPVFKDEPHLRTDTGLDDLTVLELHSVEIEEVSYCSFFFIVIGIFDNIVPYRCRCILIVFLLLYLYPGIVLDIDITAEPVVNDDYSVVRKLCRGFVYSNGIADASLGITGRTGLCLLGLTADLTCRRELLRRRDMLCLESVVIVNIGIV